MCWILILVIIILIILIFINANNSSAKTSKEIFDVYDQIANDERRHKANDLATVRSRNEPNIVVSSVILNKNTGKLLGSDDDFVEINIFGEDAEFVDNLYDVGVDDNDFMDIDVIRSDDDDAMDELNSKLMSKEIKTEFELFNWYEDYKEFKQYKFKYLRKRIKARALKESIFFVH